MRDEYEMNGELRGVSGPRSQNVDCYKRRNNARIISDMVLVVAAAIL